MASTFLLEMLSRMGLSYSSTSKTIGPFAAIASMSLPNAVEASQPDGSEMECACATVATLSSR